MKYKKFIFRLLILGAICISLKINSEQKLPSHLTSPSPLFSLGQNIVNRGELYPSFVLSYGDKSFAKLYKQDFNFNLLVTVLIPCIKYGLLDNLTLIITLPYAIINEDKEPLGILNKKVPKKIKGLHNATFQLEYAFFNKKTDTAQYQGTIFAGTRFPTSRLVLIEKLNETIIKEKIPQENAALRYILGATFSKTAPWLFFTSLGAFLGVTQKNKNPGNIISYECGIGRMLTPKYTNLTLYLEVNGIYISPSKQNLALGIEKENLIYFGPSIYFAHNNFYVSGGVQIPIYQTPGKLNQKVDPGDYRAQLSINILF